jgi:hypothetical protein
MATERKIIAQPENPRLDKDTNVDFVRAFARLRLFFIIRFLEGEERLFGWD